MAEYVNVLVPKEKRKRDYTAEVIAENKELKAENKELKATQNKMRGMLEKLAREEAEYQKRANAEVFDLKTQMFLSKFPCKTPKNMIK